MFGRRRRTIDAASPRSGNETLADLVIYARGDQLRAIRADLRADRVRSEASPWSAWPADLGAYVSPSERAHRIHEGPDVLRLSLPVAASRDELVERAEARMRDLVDDPQEWTLVLVLGTGSVLTAAGGA